MTAPTVRPMSIFRESGRSGSRCPGSAAADAAAESDGRFGRKPAGSGSYRGNRKHLRNKRGSRGRVDPIVPDRLSAATRRTRRPRLTGPRSTLKYSTHLAHLRRKPPGTSVHLVVV